MEYMKVYWKHELDDEPVIILYEIDTDNERSALRSIDIFRNGNTQNIENLCDGVIEVSSIPNVTEINSHTFGKEFHAVLISKKEFEKIWNDRSTGKVK